RRDVEVAFDGESFDQLAAGLTHGRERKWNIGQGGTGFLEELAQSRLRCRFARLDHAFGNHPGPYVAVPPKWPAGPDQQNFELTAVPPKQQDTSATRRRHWG